MKAQTEILFFFDTEDFTSNRSCDAIRDLAELMRGEGVRAHFALVGYLARQLVQWKRTDVLEALRHHIVGSHTLYHSVHPDICELTDIADYGEAYRRVLAQEAEAIGMIRAATGVERIPFVVPPGNSKSYTAMYMYADLGIPFYCDTVVCDARGSDLWYCNARHIEYVWSWEALLPGEPEVNADALLDDLAGRERAIIYCHPNMAVFREFWDKANYDKKNLAEFGAWRECPPREPLETAIYYERILSLVRRLKADERFRIVTLDDMEKREKPRPALTAADMPAVRRALLADFGPLQNPSLCLADAFQAAARLLRGERAHRPGKVRGFLNEPVGADESRVVRAEDLREAARRMNLDGFLPERIAVGGRDIGPADFLYAALDAICDGAEEIAIRPRPQMNRLSALPQLEGFRIAGSWIHSDSFRDEYLSDRLRLQAWTLRRE